MQSEMRAMIRAILMVALVTALFVGCAGTLARAEENGFRYIPAAPLDQEGQQMVWRIAGEYGVEPELMLALIMVESEGNPNAKSKTHDYGLTQINRQNLPEMKRLFGITMDNIFDPELNVRGGTYMIADALGRWGDMHKALIEYNMGPKKAKQYDTTKYSRKVMGLYEQYKGAGDE